jgi:predicted dehydrogenase
MVQRTHRRELLKVGVAAGLSALAGPAPAQEKAESHARPVRVGVIGTGGRGTYLLSVFLQAGVEVSALCDIHKGRLGAACDLVAKARSGRRPAEFNAGPRDYQRMLQRDDLEAVIIATPMQIHAAMAIDAMRAGKHVLSEVAAAMTLDDCWGLVRTAEETGKIYMLSENCCYYDYVLMMANIVKAGLFGELTYAECGYVHNCSSLMFDAEGKLTWRGEMVRDFAGNLYPTHAIGPVAKWLGINRGDRMVSLVAGSTTQGSIREYVRSRFPADHAARQVAFRSADSTSVLIRTAKGRLIDLRYDISSPHPLVSTTYYSLQGTKGSYESRTGSIWLNARTPSDAWEPAARYAQEFESPLWRASRQQAAGAGHGGADLFTVRAYLDTVRQNGPPPVDCYDAATWSAVIPLSAKSLAEGGRQQDFPDFTGGKWATREG